MDVGNSFAVDLSRKNLLEIPKEIHQKCREIQKLDLSHNPRISLYNTIGRFDNLKELVLQDCALRDVPDEIGKLTKLELLNLSHNSLKEGLNPLVGSLRHLNNIDISHCEIEILPDSFWELEELQVLNLSENALKNGLNPSVGRLRHLKNLHLRDCELQNLPDTFWDLEELEELYLSANALKNGLSPAVGRLRHLKKLDLSWCKLQNFPDTFGNLKELEELNLTANPLQNGLNPSVGRLRHLKKLDLSFCKLQNLPDTFWNLEELEELYLSANALKNGLSPSIGRLRHLKKLDLSSCKLQNLPDTFWELEQLEVIYLSANALENGLNPSVGRLRHLKKLDLSCCELQNLPDTFGELEELEVLSLSQNSFGNDLNPSVGRLRHLKNLDLSYCQLHNLPDSFEYLKELTKLDLSGNCMNEYPSCILKLKNLKRLEISVDRTISKGLQISGEQRQSQHGISSLPMALVDTNLTELILDENPITDPPEAIWRQGLDAIKSYFREKYLGADELCPDTINMIGDVSAGKTSIAQSLCHGSPHFAGDDRTRVMEQVRAKFDENSKLFVNINDFGGHEIYRHVIPIFLPTDGLTILAYDMSLHHDVQKDTVNRWLLTAIAKLKNIRVIVAGTHCDLKSPEERKDLHEKMYEYVLSLLEDVKQEVDRHIKRLEPPSSIFDEKKLIYLNDLLLRLGNADVSVVTLNCRKPGQGLNELRDNVSKKLRKTDIIPVRWFGVMKSILHELSEYPYLKWSKVQSLYREKVPDGDGDKDLFVILRYLVSTSQVIWLEHHEQLKELIFHSPQRILKICKDVLSHDHAQHIAPPSDANSDMDIVRYSKGILHQPFMMHILSDKESAAVSIEFLKNFNLISEIAADDGSKTYVIPSNLPIEEPQLMKDLEQRLHSCPNSVAIKLLFLGSLLPMSFLETSFSSMLTIAKGLFKEDLTTEQWRHGLIILYDEVRFTAKRHDNILTLAAFSENWTSNPWAVLLPIVKGIYENITASWHGATPESYLLCPACRISGRHGGAVGWIEVTLKRLVTKVQRRRAKRPCPQCATAIPPYLCFPVSADFTADEIEELKTFFTKHGMSVAGDFYRSSATTNKAFSEDSTEPLTTGGAFEGMAPAVRREVLSENLRVAQNQITERLTKEKVDEILSKLCSSQSSCISPREKESVEAVIGAIKRADALVDILRKKDARVILRFVVILRAVGELELADMVRFGSADGR